MTLCWLYMLIDREHLGELVDLLIWVRLLYGEMCSCTYVGAYVFWIYLSTCLKWDLAILSYVCCQMHFWSGCTTQPKSVWEFWFSTGMLAPSVFYFSYLHPEYSFMWNLPSLLFCNVSIDIFSSKNLAVDFLS